MVKSKFDRFYDTAFFHPVVTGGSRLFLARDAADGLKTHQTLQPAKDIV